MDALLTNGDTVSSSALSSGFTLQLHDQTGAAVGPAFTESVSGLGFYTLDSVAALSTGGYIADYSYDGPLLPGTLFYEATFTADGALTATPVALNPLSSPSQGAIVTPQAITAPPDAAGAEVARLYDAVLGRLPDQAGEIYWTQALDSGAVSLTGVTQAFVASAEFQSTYGALGNTQFVDTLYSNALHRSADPAGEAYWSSFLAAGHSRADVVLAFSESAEHVALTAAHIDQGVWLA